MKTQSTTSAIHRQYVPQMDPESAETSKQNGTSYKRSASTPRLQIISKMAHESPSYLARSKHPDGDMIVIADYSGRIKILRQDCAYHTRRFENRDAHPTISRRILRRSNSGRRSVTSSIRKEFSHKHPRSASTLAQLDHPSSPLQHRRVALRSTHP